MKKKQKELPPLTTEQLRTYPGLENLSDEEAEEVKYTFEKLAEIAFEMWMDPQTREKMMEMQKSDDEEKSR